MKNQTETTAALQQRMGRLLGQALQVSGPVQQLHRIREKIGARGYQGFDREDILGGLGQLQQVLGEIHGEMLAIGGLLREKGDEKHRLT